MVAEYEIDGKKWFLPHPYWNEQCEGIRNFAKRPDDVWIMTQPRSGTTLTQELTWLLKNNLDFETAKKFHLINRAPAFAVSLYPRLWKNCQIIRPSVEDPEVLESVPVDTSKHSYEVYADLRSPRIFKTHLSLSVHNGILESGSKVIYVLRNPKDSLLSKARLLCSGNEPLSKQNPLELVKASICNEPCLAVVYHPFWQHVKEAWAERHNPNLLFMYYEEYRADLPAAIKKIAAFLGTECNDEQMAQLVDHLEINNFRNNPMVNDVPGWEDNMSNFIGNGHVGEWKDVLTPNLKRDMDLWIEENTKGTDIALPFLSK